MRHGDKINNLGRTASHRSALLANLTIALIEHKRITTTLAKAKALRRYAEPLITKAKDNSTHSRRIVFGHLQNKEALKELFGTVAEKVGERPGGYLRIIKLGFRRGDGAETAMIELVDFNETYNPNVDKVRQAKKTRRGGRKAPGSLSAEALAKDESASSAEALAKEESASTEAIAQEEFAPIVEEQVSVIEPVVETAPGPVAAPVEEPVAEVAEPMEVAAEETVEVAEEPVATIDEAPAEEASSSVETSAGQEATADKEEKKEDEQA